MLTDFLGSLKGKLASKLGRTQGDEEEQKKPSEQDGNAAPQTELTEAQRKYGPNYEQLEEQAPHIVAALRQLSLEYRAEGAYAQRRRILRTRYARLFKQGIQYALPNSATGDFDDATMGQGISSAAQFGSDPAGERFQYVTNLYQAYWASFVALVSQDIPSWICYPVSREVQEDITAAKVGYDIGDLIERNNNPYESMQKVADYFWTDGVCFQYWRYKVDGEQFGYKEMPIQGARDTVLDGQRMTVPEDGGTEKIPNGREVVSYLGVLEVNAPIWSDDFHEFPYLQWNSEPHRARLKAAYPHAAKNIDTSAGLTADELYARMSRLAVKQNIGYNLPGDALENLPTFSRTWFRKWAFQRFTDEDLIAELETLFPDGCYLALAGIEYCESRNESMDDHWRVKHAFPGDGQARPAVGDCLIDVQERYNALSNQQAETYAYGIPPIYADPQVVDFDALAGQSAEPATYFPGRARPGMALADGFYSPDPAKEPVTLAETMQELIGPVAQFLTGIFSAAAGGPMEGVAGKTMGGYQIARDQAMGRVGMIYRRMKEFYAEGIGLGLEIFKASRPEDVEVPFPGENDEEKAKWIRLADFKGNIMVEAEADESFPRLKSQQRDVIMAILENAAALPPQFLALFDNPKSITFVKNILGLSELQDSNEDAELKAMRTIQRLIAAEPFQPPPQPQMNPETKQVALVPAPPRASEGINDIFDRHDVMLETAINWANSDAGQDEQRNNPKGFMNVYFWAKELAQIIAQKAAANKLPPKPPSESIALKDLPTGGKVQMAAQAGLQLDPAEMDAKEQQDRSDKANELQAKLGAKNQSGGGE